MMNEESNDDLLEEQMEFVVQRYMTPDTLDKLLLTRDFRTMMCDQEAEWQRVMRTPGTFCILESTGSGMYTSWYLFHSKQYKQCFMVWRTGESWGCRTDLERVCVLNK